MENDLEINDLFTKDIGMYIHPRYNLLKEITETRVSDIIVSVIKKTVSNYQLKLNDLELLLLVCNYIENMKIKRSNKKKVNKIDIIKTIYHNLFNILFDSQEMLLVLKNVDFLNDSKKIKKISLFKKISLNLKKSLKLM